ncbi:MAG: glycosyltransferase family 4 protein [Methylovirgula sp.]
MALAYDITRLITRVLNVTPNGIDRVDFALAQHFLAHSEGSHFGVIAAGLRPELIACDAAFAAIEGIGAHWGETKELEEDPGYRAVVAHLTGECGMGTTQGNAAARVIEGRSGRVRGVLRWIAKYGLPLGRPPRKHLPDSSYYLNVSQFPLWIPGYFEWLEARPDIKSVFFIHDLLPLQLPQYFRPGEFARHSRRMENLARFGTAALVTSEVVKADLAEHLRSLGRGDMPIFSAPIPAAAIFSEMPVLDPQLASQPYFVCCGTLEPRKNHLMLLNVWRDLVRSGKEVPKLILVGARGWDYDPIVDLLNRSPELRANVIEVSGLTSPALKRLLDNARALLMPSFAEGYGLPVREALAAGTPVIASDIPAFREISDPKLQLISPLDADAWLSAILALAERFPGVSGSQVALQEKTANEPSSLAPEDPTRADLARPHQAFSGGKGSSSDLSGHAGGWAAYFAKLDAFLREI